MDLLGLEDIASQVMLGLNVQVNNSQQFNIEGISVDMTMKIMKIHIARLTAGVLLGMFQPVVHVALIQIVNRVIVSLGEEYVNLVQPA